MGCGGSKSTKVEPNANGNQKTKELTKTQIELVRKTWEVVNADLQTHGIAFYTRLFTEHPELQQLFSFRDIEGLDKLKEDDGFKHQAKRVMGMVGSAVDGLDDISSLTAILKDLGVKHVQYNIKEEHYEPVGEALIFTLQTGLGDQFTADVKEAWLTLYGIVADSMKAGAREAESAS